MAVDTALTLADAFVAVVIAAAAYAATAALEVTASEFAATSLADFAGQFAMAESAALGQAEFVGHRFHLALSGGQFENEGRLKLNLLTVIGQNVTHGQQFFGIFPIP